MYTLYTVYIQIFEDSRRSVYTYIKYIEIQFFKSNFLYTYITIISELTNGSNFLVLSETFDIHVYTGRLEGSEISVYTVYNVYIEYTEISVLSVISVMTEIDVGMYSIKHKDTPHCFYI